MARLDKVASRYAKAIFDYQANAKVKDLVKELEAFSQVLVAHKDLQQMTASEFFSGKKQKAVVKDLAEKMKLGVPASQTLQVIAEAKRLASLPNILERLKVLMLEAAGVTPLKVETATTMTADQREKVEGRFAKLLGQKVEATYATDDRLIGGLRVTAGNRTFDGSISGWLSAVEEQLVEGVL